MSRILYCVLLGLVAISLSANAEEEQDSQEVESFLDESVELARHKRDADPAKGGKKDKKNGNKKNRNGAGKGRKGKGRKGGKKNRGNKKKNGAKKGKKNNKRKGGKKNKKPKKPKKGKKAEKKNKNKAAKRKNKAGKKKNNAGKKKNNAGKRKKNAEKRKIKAGRKAKNGGRRKTGGNGRSPCSRAVNSTCLDVAVKLQQIVNSRITNFLVQQKRMENFNSTGAKKKNKKGIFAPIATKVIDVGGGNASDLSCSGNKTNAGAAKLKSIISSLQKCETSIRAACDTSAYPHPNKTTAAACKKDMESMKSTVKACAKKSGDSGACDCWLNATLKATAERVKKCDISSENKKVTEAHKLCKSNFSACKKIEDEAVSYIYACSQSASDLKAKAAAVKKNIDALTAAKKKTETLAGSSSGRDMLIRKRGERSVSTCADYISLSSQLLALAVQAQTNAQIAAIATVLSTVSDTLTCSTAEKTTLTKQVTTYTFQIVVYTDTYSSFKSSIEDASGTVSDAEIEAAGTTDTSTKRTSLKRNRFIRDLVNNMN